MIAPQLLTFVYYQGGKPVVNHVLANMQQICKQKFD